MMVMTTTVVVAVMISLNLVSFKLNVMEHFIFESYDLFSPRDKLMM